MLVPAVLYKEQMEDIKYHKITLDANYVVKTYPSDVLDQLQKYVGQKIEF